MIAMLVGKNREPVHHPFESQKSRLIFLWQFVFWRDRKACVVIVLRSFNLFGKFENLRMR